MSRALGPSVGLDRLELLAAAVVAGVVSFFGRRYYGGRYFGKAYFG